MPAEIIKDEGKKHGHFLLFIFLLFIAVLSFLVYTSFYNPHLSSTLTGSVIGSPEKEGMYEVKGELTLPENLAVDSSIKKVGFKIREPLDILVGNERVHLSSDSSFIVGNFTGSFSISVQNISHFQGEAREVFVNGLPISQKEGEQIGVSADRDFSYSFVSLDDVYFDEISYPASGNLQLQKGKIHITLDKDVFELKSFRGNIELTKNNLRLIGKFDDFDMSDFIPKTIANSS